MTRYPLKCIDRKCRCGCGDKRQVFKHLSKIHCTWITSVAVAVAVAEVKSNIHETWSEFNHSAMLFVLGFCFIYFKAKCYDISIKIPNQNCLTKNVLSNHIEFVVVSFRMIGNCLEFFKFKHRTAAAALPGWYLFPKDNVFKDVNTFGYSIYFGISQILPVDIDWWE